MLIKSAPSGRSSAEAGDPRTVDVCAAATEGECGIAPPKLLPRDAPFRMVALDALTRLLLGLRAGLAQPRGDHHSCHGGNVPQMALMATTGVADLSWLDLRLELRALLTAASCHVSVRGHHRWGASDVA